LEQTSRLRQTSRSRSGPCRSDALARGTGSEAIKLAPQPLARETEPDLTGIGKIATPLLGDEQRFQTAFSRSEPPAARQGAIVNNNLA
jgi:hypothetical protein